MSSAYFKTEGIIMKKMPFGEADFLVRALTKDFGKIDILAKGARKTISKLNSHLDMLNHTRLSFVKNGERIPTLTDAEVMNRCDDWFLSADALSVAGRILQTLDTVILPMSKDEKLFESALKFFRPEADQPWAGDVKILESKAINFLCELFQREGYGDTLPPEHEERIIKLWPMFK